MPDRTPIQWTDATWNPIRGCSRVSEGCRHCYAEAIAARFSGPGQAYEGLARRRANGEPQWTGVVRVAESHMLDPIRWRKGRRIFVNSMSDLFHENVADDTIDEVFAVMAIADHHTFQVLTKRPARMLAYMSERFQARTDLGISSYSDTLTRRSRVHDAIEAIVYGPDGINRFRSERWWTDAGNLRAVHREWPLSNVWLGVSVENQAAADERIPLLLETPAVVRLLSCEPLLEAVDLTRFIWGKSEPCAECPKDADCDCGYQTRRWLGQPSLDWVIVGGESGPDARPFRVEWARSIIGQCRSAEVPVFVKQLGRWVQGNDGEFRGVNTWLLDDANEKTAFSLFDSHGGDMEEWPEQLRVREFPAETEASAR